MQFLRLSVHNDNKMLFESLLKKWSDSTFNWVVKWEILEDRVTFNSTVYNIYFTDSMAIWQCAYHWAKSNELK